MGPGGGSVGHHATQDPVAQMNTFRSYVSMLADPGSKDENKLKAAQALSEDLEVGEAYIYCIPWWWIYFFRHWNRWMM